MAVPVSDPAVKVVERPAFTIRFEQVFGDVTFIHADVRRWTPRVADEFRSAVAFLRALRGAPLHAFIHPDNLKLKKFAALFGFEMAAVTPRSDGPWEIWRLP